MSPSVRTFVRAPRAFTALVGFALSLIAAVPASAQTPVVYGDTITDPGVYFLAGNQTGSGGDGIVIESDDVVLLLTRFTLRGDGSNRGILCSGYDNVSIYGGRVTNFGVGVAMLDGEDCTIQGTRIDHCGGDGLVLFSMIDSSFLRLRCDDNAHNGVEASKCHASRLVSILAHDNGRDGIFLAEDAGLVDTASGLFESLKVKLCWAAYNRLDGIRVRDLFPHELTRNQCVANGQAGIHLNTLADNPGAAAVSLTGPSDNVVTKNWCVFNHDGILVDAEAHANTFTENTALANFGRDLVDHNPEPPCANTWFLNFFFSKDGAGEDCIF